MAGRADMRCRRQCGALSSVERASATGPNAGAIITSIRNLAVQREK